MNEFKWVKICCNLSFGLTTKARACKSVRQEGGPRDTSYIPEWEWTLTPPRQLPVGELKSRWIPNFLGSNCRGENPLDWKKIYIIGKLLKHRCLNWARMIHLDIWNISYGQKKVKNRPGFLSCRWRATYRWKDLDEGYNFVLNLISIKGLHTKLWPSKITRVLTLGILGLPFERPRTKCHLDVGLVKRHKVYYKGEGGGFPQVRGVMSLVSSNLLMAHLSTKSLPTMH